jgi:hypothetical protein
MGRNRSGLCTRWTSGRDTKVSDVSWFGSCQSLHTLDLSCTDVSDVTVLASCKSLRTLGFAGTQVSDVSDPQCISWQYDQENVLLRVS